MIIKYLPVLIVSLPTANLIDLNIISNLDYTTPHTHCQEETYKNTLEYNYITTEELIESNGMKFQDIIF